MLKSVYRVDSCYDVQEINLESPDQHIGKSTCIIKRSGIWPVVVRCCGRVLARLENSGDEVRLLALAQCWVVL